MYNKIVILEKTNVEKYIILDLKAMTNVIEYTTVPTDEIEIIKRISDSQAILVSWNTQITANVIDKCPNLKYIGMCCSYFSDESSNVAKKYAKSKGITVTDVKDYGDDGVNYFGASIQYYNRNKRDDVNYEYIEDKNELIATSDVIITALPRNNKIIKSNDIINQSNKLFINVGIGLPMDTNVLNQWMQYENNADILDVIGTSVQLKTRDNIIISNKVTGLTNNAMKRLANKSLKNIKMSIND